MLTDYAARVVGIVGITLRKGETPDDDVCLLEVLLADGTYASTWWDIGPDWREETKGRRVVAIQRASFRREDDLLVIEPLLEDGSVAYIRWHGSRMWSFLTRVPDSLHARPADVSVQ